MMQDDEINTDDLWERPGFLIRRLNQIHHTVFFEALRGDITPLQYGLLTVVGARGGLDQTTLGAELGTDRTTLAGTIEQLELKGYVRREIHYSDRRRKTVEITLRGKKILNKTAADMHQAQMKLLAPLPPASRKTFIQMMKTLVEGNNHRGSVPIKRFSSQTESFD
ncbi:MULTISPECIES: MarR family winged helix-turn-helix transcriptional regulator [Dickeya]|uniref:MarR family winged helix-turn-helix transcriptional regulator n=1 Tax=Dickeya TaxID=204037 RepID=UPI0003AB3C28|nr:MULTISPECIES: MarR family winged helix-turn-helix transcriptional regulator [Dickeya]UGA50106.1 MarR family winged helix-turn-helix transcriptional regulator [Dickeya fangzhongdai]ULR30172.1 MarR family winged helix-turn-helix transcriptional regulator [Dickeya fangzhongdai]UMB75825.1 MarR family winged helix-turn-helix transcriptional regulator [Dickeya fangzhongdai]UWH06461.1 MarR family winged helix-turn-helix transcriptional regulator [Dickeya fangzhongdai]WES89255.1 MarR family winged 